MQNNDSEMEDVLLNNTLLFGVIRKNKTAQEKIKKIKKYLDRGADINATDANYKNNSPLHIAVIKEEPELVSFLLEQGAQVNNRNSDNRTALDIAYQSDKTTCQIKEIITILETYYYHNNLMDPSNPNMVGDILTRNHLQCSKEEKDDHKTNVLTTLETTHLADTSGNLDCPCNYIKNQTQLTVNSDNPKQQHCSKKNKLTKGNNSFCYQKRTGTSGLSGQLYETKLLSLILFRALYVQEVEKFLIATNVESMGAFDDIVFRYHSNKVKIPKIMFIQAKHRDNPTKDKLTVEEIMKSNGDFSLHKYLESYLRISQMFVPENHDEMFKGEFKTMDCEFVIYTSAFENFNKMKAMERTEGKCFINTSKGKVFQFDYDDQDVKLLVQTVAKSRAVILAKRLSRFIYKDNYSNMMMDDLIKTYHVFLARHILEMELTNAKPHSNFHFAKLRESFFTSNDSLLLAFKATLCKEVLLAKKNISNEKIDEIEILRSMTFKVPVNFGNKKFCFSGTEQKKEKKIEYLCSKLKKLFEKAAVVSTNIVVKVDDNMVGPNEILQCTDLESYRLGGLVGNLLVFDNVTKTLKFNSELDTLSEDNLKLLERLQKEVFLEKDLSKYRLDINVQRFPRLSLVHEEYDKRLIKEFLSKLIFYTNQATEDEVEITLKKEIDKYFVGSIPRQSDALFRVKSDAIFLKVHDRIQKWWKHPIKAPYLTDSCKYFFQAEQDILNSPLLSILNFTYTKTIRNTLSELKFKDTALQLLHLDSFFAGSARILSIITEENAFSSIKLLQYFNEQNVNDYSFINLDYIGIRNYFADVKSELKESRINTLIIVSKSECVIADILLLVEHFKGKIIIISNRDLALQINETLAENIVVRVDGQTGFQDLADTMRKMLLEERCIVFQGKEVPLGILFNDKSYNLIKSSVLYKIINNEKITIGNSFNNPSYDEILDYYINEQVCRYITLDSSVQTLDELNILKYTGTNEDVAPDKDIVLITDKEEKFAEFCNRHENCNVHWFIGDDCLVWQKSRGNMLNILKYIHRDSHDACILQPVTLKDLREKVVIISAEPGMGKTSLLTYLAINTKYKYPSLWISKINLLEYTNEFKRIKENKINIDLKEAVKFLFRAIGFEACKGCYDKKADFDFLIDQVTVIGEDIYLNKIEKESNFTGLNLLEIELFIECFNNDNVALLFDGFDEICPDFASEFLQLVNILKNSKVVHLWVTSRLYNVLHQLENTLQTFSFTIQPFSYDNQLEFLEKIWSKKLGPNKLDIFPHSYWGMKDVIKGFLKVLSAVLSETNNKFISMPLHLYMISEIFQDSFHSFPHHAESTQSFISYQNTMNKVNLNKLYEQFVDVKFFKIRFGEKKPLLCINDPDMRKLIDNERAAFFYMHKIIAAYVIFGKADGIELFDCHDIVEIRNFVERIKVGEEKTGIIEQIIQDEPKFVHYTFAEYFATEFFCDRLTSFECRTSLWVYLINTFLQSDEGGPRRFFNAKLGNHPQMFNVIYNADLKVMFETLLQQHEKFANLLFMSIDEYLENIALFLLKSVKTVLNKKNLNDFIKIISKTLNESCVLCIAVERSAKKAVTFIVELIKDIDVNRLIDLFHCCDLPKYNPMVLAYRAYLKGVQPNLEILDILWSDLPPLAIAEIFYIKFGNKMFNISKRLIHKISQSQGNIVYKCTEEALKKLTKEQLMNILRIKDSEKKLAAHRAASKQCYQFFDILDHLLDRCQFKELCMTEDGSGLTPLHYFDYKKQDCDKLKTLLDKVYESSNTEKLTLNYFIEKKQ